MGLVTAINTHSQWSAVWTIRMLIITPFCIPIRRHVRGSESGALDSGLVEPMFRIEHLDNL